MGGRWAEEADLGAQEPNLTHKARFEQTASEPDSNDTSPRNPFEIPCDLFL